MGYIRKTCRLCVNENQRKIQREKAKRLKLIRSYYS